MVHTFFSPPAPTYEGWRMSLSSVALALLTIGGCAHAQSTREFQSGNAGVRAATPYAPLDPLVGVWDTGPAGDPPAFVQRFLWGPNQGYLVFSTSLLSASGAEHLHFEGPVMWNARTGRFDYLFAVEPGSFAQEQGEITAHPDGSFVREVALTNAEGSVGQFRQTFRPLGEGRFETSLMRRTGDSWAPTFPGSDHLIMVRRG